MGNTLHNRVNRQDLKARLRQEATPRTTLSFYMYTHLKDVQAFRNDLYRDLRALDVFGRIYVAEEGINAQLAVPSGNLERLKQYLYSYPFMLGMRLNIAVEDDGKSFFTLAVKVRDKIVADGIADPDFDVVNSGTHLDAAAFNALTDQPDTIVVDMRNHYESEVGHFEKAILPPMVTFREGLPMVADMLEENKDKHIVMYCTGGIRCEKASAYLRYRGFGHVYQLEGGIIEYARQAEQQGLPNKFIGKNFVFDERLGERISPDVIATCHQCGESCDDHTNCANDACHLLFIQCPSCRDEFDGCCSMDCREFKYLPEEQRKEERKHRVFNGTQFSKSKPGFLSNKQ